MVSIRGASHSVYKVFETRHLPKMYYHDMIALSWRISDDRNVPDLDQNAIRRRASAADFPSTVVLIHVSSSSVIND